MPEGIDVTASKAWPRALPGADLHALHIWALSTTSNVLTVRLVMPNGCPSNAFLKQTGHVLEARFRIARATCQAERGMETECRLPDPARP